MQEANEGTTDEVTCTFVKNVSGNAGASITDVVEVTGTDDDGNPVKDDDDATVTITDLPSSIVVTKTANPTSVPQPGGPVTFTVLVRNTSVSDDVTLTAAGFTDKVGAGPVEVISNIDCNGAAAGSGLPLTLQEANEGTTDEVTCTFVKNVSGNAGASITDVVEVTGTDDDGNPVKDDDDATVTITPNPGTLIVRKIVINDNGGTRTADTFTFQVNGGQVQPFPNDGGDPLMSETSLSVAGGQGYTVTEPAVTGYVTTYENCTVQIGFGQTATCTITNNDIPRGVINVIKTASPTSIKEPGGTVNFTIEVQNTGLVNVTVNSVVDDKFGNLANVAGGSPAGCFAVPFVLAPGASSTCTFPKALTGAGGTSHINVVTVTGTDTSGNTVTDTDDARVDFTARLIDLVIVKNATTPTPLNEVVTYTMTVTNKGPDSATNVQLVDPAPAGILY